MIRSIVLISVLCSMLMLAGCAAEQQRAFPETVSLHSLAGVVLKRPDGLWFQPCHERLWWPLQDFTGQQELNQFYETLTTFSQEDLYMEFQGGVDPARDNRLLVKTIETVGGTSGTCHFRLEGLRFRAASTAPYWIADIMKDRVFVKSVSPMGHFQFKTVEETDISTEPVNTDDTQEARSDLVARYREIKPAKKPLQIDIYRKRCIDSQTGTLLPFSSEMMFFGKRYHGCARAGHPVTEGVSGFYWHQPEGKSQVMFKLNSNHKVQLVTRGSDGKAVIERGSWQFLKSGKLIFSMRDLSQKEYLMLFRRETDGQLVLQAGSGRLASSGAAFKLWQPSGLSGGQLLGGKSSANKAGPSTTLSSESENGEPRVDLIDPPSRQSSGVLPSLTESVLVGPVVQAADIDDELLKEIIVNEDDNDNPNTDE